MSLIEKQNEACKTSINDENNNKRIILKEARYELKIRKQKQKNKLLANKANKIEDLQKEDPRIAWKAIKEVAKGFYGHQKKVQVNLKDQDGHTNTNHEEVSKIL